MTAVKKKPDNMPWITPYLAVSDPKKALEFYEKAFGFQKRFAMEGKDGQIVHAEMQHREGVIMMGPEMEDYAKSPKALGHRPSIGLYIYVDDVDALYRRAIGAGAKTFREPQDQFYGDRNCTVVDHDGYMWTFGTHVKDVTDEDLAKGCE
jgi:PhnB protein